MFKNTTLFLLILSFQCIGAQITLTHNIGTTPIETDMFSCERDESWSRVFKLSDFGILPSDQFIIKSGQVALSKSYSGARLQFAIYSIDSNFPNFFHSSHPRTILGVRGIGQAPVINGSPEIIQVDFDEPIVVPAGVERILVTVHKIEDFYNPESAQVFIAGTKNDTGTSWYLGCEETYSLTPTTDLKTPVPDANFYINVTGEVLKSSSYGSTTRLTHNVCDDIIETNIYSCTSSYIYWARTFNLEDFGISTNEEFTISSGQVGITKTGWLPEISFNIYKIDNNFPASFSETDLIGSSQYQRISPYIDRNPQIVQVDFDTPIVIPANVERILVEVHKGIIYGDGVAFIAGSSQDNDQSWQRGCNTVSVGTNEYISTADFGFPNANFYINITGNVNHVSNNFEMYVSNICSEFLKEFSVEDKANVASIVWDFGDPASGVNNTSTDLSPFHDFSADGTYTITATVTGNDSSVEILSETIDVKEPPNAYGISDFYACEDSYNSGISSSFNLSTVEQQVLGGQANKTVIYVDGSGNQYNTLPNPFKNTIRDRETITVRVSHNENPCCYSETTFDLITNPLPELKPISDLYVCDDNTNGFAFFDLQQVQSSIINNTNNINVEFYHENGQQILPPLNAVRNLIMNEEVITARAINSITYCNNETTFKLMINQLPVANALAELIGCDDDNDGISEYFDTSNVESDALGNQTGMVVSYFNTNGGQLPNPLPNPFSNSIANQETITVRITNPLTNCHAETPLVLKTASQPRINKPKSLFECDLGNGVANFDTSNIESELIGNQNGLRIIYSDTHGNLLPSPLASTFQNTIAWSQTINVKVENELNSSCYSETSFDLIVNELPRANINETYFICNLEPSLTISVDDDLDTYIWKYQNGDTISNTHGVTLINAGNYILTVGKNKNGIYCENSYEFELIRSTLPTITEVKYEELSNNNYIEIIADGDGDFEYSINGINYQNDNVFNNVSGGIYTVSLRDKKGCGEDFEEVVLIDYPKYFTPNNDGVNDTWQIEGIKSYPNAMVYVFDRYGKLLKQISPNSTGWDGTFGGKSMISTDYWFKADLGDGKVFSGHFALKR